MRDEIIFQFNIRRIDKPPFVEGSVEIKPKSFAEMFALCTMAMLAFEKMLNDTAAEEGFSIVADKKVT